VITVPENRTCDAFYNILMNVTSTMMEIIPISHDQDFAGTISSFITPSLK
jgi:hypothetical protein